MINDLIHISVVVPSRVAYSIHPDLFLGMSVHIEAAWCFPDLIYPTVKVNDLSGPRKHLLLSYLLIKFSEQNINTPQTPHS